MKFIPKKPALMVGDILVVADLHNGVEYELHKKGVEVPSQTQTKFENLREIVEQTKPKRIVILGDLKHNFPITSRQEYYEVPEFLEGLQPYADEIIITKGNHDGNIEKLVPPSASVVNEFIEKKTGFFHGHTSPSDEILSTKDIVTAHTHPSILLKDIRPYIQPVWIEAPLKERESKVTVVPAFDDNIRGIALNVSEPVGPLLTKMADMAEAEIYLLDGSYIGKLGELKEES